VRQEMLKKILITGPESTGKSFLSKALAKHYNGRFVGEYAREYIGELNRDYNENDLLIIAKRQIALEDTAKQKADGFLFCDTGLAVIDIWSQEKYKRTDNWIKEELDKRKYDLCLLCDIDLPWEYDPQRENPDDRDRLLSLYRQSFTDRQMPYFMVKGIGKQRLINAVNIVNDFIKSAK